MSATRSLGGEWTKCGRPISATFDPGCMTTCSHEKRAEVFSLLSCPSNHRQLLFFKLTEVETKVPFANSISAFSRSQDPQRIPGCSGIVSTFVLGVPDDPDGGRTPSFRIASEISWDLN
jgi:hypothetical protein